MNNYTLKQFLQERISQLRGRETTIKSFLENKDKGLGKSKFTKADLVTVQFLIKESEATLEFLKQYHTIKIKAIA